MTYPVKGLHYGPALAVTLWTQAGSIPGNQARAGSVVLGSFINIVTGQPEGHRRYEVTGQWHGSVMSIVTSACAVSPTGMAPQHHRDAAGGSGFTLPVSDAASSLGREGCLRFL